MAIEKRLIAECLPKEIIRASRKRIIVQRKVLHWRTQPMRGFHGLLIKNYLGNWKCPGDNDKWAGSGIIPGRQIKTRRSPCLPRHIIRRLTRQVKRQCMREFRKTEAGY